MQPIPRTVLAAARRTPRTALWADEYVGAMADEDPDEQRNPFEGSPFEQLFAMFGGQLGGQPGQPGQPGGGLPGGMPDLSALMGQMQAMFQPYDGAVNWNLAKDVAR